MAPEIINEDDTYDEKVDVLIFFILSGGKMQKIKISEICNGKKAEIPSEFTQFSKDLINSCWNFDPKQRPSFDEICTLMENNKYNLIDLDETNMNEALGLIKQHKKRIPPYSLKIFEEYNLFYFNHIFFLDFLFLLQNLFLLDFIINSDMIKNLIAI